MALGAVIDEARFEAGLDAGDDGLVDVALALLLACGLDVEVDQLLAVDDGHPELLRLGGVEQHAFHGVFPARIRPGVRRGETEAARLARRDAIERRTRAKSTMPGSDGCGTNESGARQSDLRVRAPAVSAGVAVRSRGVRWASCYAFKRSGSRLPTIGRTIAKTREASNRGSLRQKSSLSAPRNAPLRTGRKPGAETALFLYHPYFSGAQRPDGQWI